MYLVLEVERGCRFPVSVLKQIHELGTGAMVGHDSSTFAQLTDNARDAGLIDERARFIELRVTTAPVRGGMGLWIQNTEIAIPMALFCFPEGTCQKVKLDYDFPDVVEFEFSDIVSAHNLSNDEWVLIRLSDTQGHVKEIL